MAHGFVEGFAKWLDSTVPIRVKIAEDGETLLPGVVYVAPQERHLGARPSGCAALSDAPPVGGFRPAATYLFQSAAEAFGRQMVALILTGMGRDGVDGLRHVRDAGGVTVAQDEASSVVFGMPGAAVAEKLADAVLPIDRMAEYLSALVAGRCSVKGTADEAAEFTNPNPRSDPEIPNPKQLLTQLSQGSKTMEDRPMSAANLPRRLRVLLVEDSRTQAALIAAILESYEVLDLIRVLEDGEQAWPTCAARAPTRVRNVPTWCCSICTCRRRMGSKSCARSRPMRTSARSRSSC